MQENIKNIIKTVLIIAVFTFFSVIFRNLGFHESNIIIVFVLAVLFVSKFTDGYIFGIIGSIIGVLSFNFFFTEPYYSLRTYREDYPLTFLVMLIVAIITSTQTTKIKKEKNKSLEREKSIQILYNLNKGLLQVKSKKEILEFHQHKNVPLLPFLCTFQLHDQIFVSLSHILQLCIYIRTSNM